MGMSRQDNLCAASYGLWGLVGLNEMNELLDFISRQRKWRQ
jgi:hypothetical protein